MNEMKMVSSKYLGVCFTFLSHTSPTISVFQSSSSWALHPLTTIFGRNDNVVTGLSSFLFNAVTEASDNNNTGLLLENMAWNKTFRNVLVYNLSSCNIYTKRWISGCFICLSIAQNNTKCQSIKPVIKPRFTPFVLNERHKKFCCACQKVVVHVS